jgi:NAD(P)-dependent dehydrogenase (short-subunit alcohol dehydrogenase family)
MGMFDGKVAIITGGGSGIGRSHALAFAKEGAKVVVNDLGGDRAGGGRGSEAADGVVMEIKTAGGEAVANYETVASREGAESILWTALSKYGRVDILVNNAGHYGPVLPVERYPVEEFDQVIAIHLRAAFVLSKLVLPEMYARKSGVILNISSLSAKSAFGWGSAYAAAKAGLLGLTRVLAAEASRQGVRVNALCPGPVTETRMSKELGNTLAEKLGVSPEEQLKGFLSSLLQGRGQTAMEIAEVALFLCSDQSSAVVGQSLNVDGGGAFF